MEDTNRESFTDTLDKLAGQLQDCCITDEQINPENLANVEHSLEDVNVEGTICDNLYEKFDEMERNATSLIGNDHNNASTNNCSQNKFDIKQAGKNAVNFTEVGVATRQKPDYSNEKHGNQREILNNTKKLCSSDCRDDDVQGVAGKKALIFPSDDFEPVTPNTYKLSDRGRLIMQKQQRETSVVIQAIDFDSKLFDSAVESVDCDMCFVAGKVVNPTSYCYTCQIYLCGTCYKYHTNISTTSDHSIVHRNDLMKNVYKNEVTKSEKSAKEKQKEKPLKMNRKLVEPCRYKTEHVREEETVCAQCITEGRRENGSGFCVTCSQYLCIKCKSFHLKFEASRDHEIVHKHTMEESDFKTFVPAYSAPVQPVTTIGNINRPVQISGSISTFKMEIPSDKSTDINWKRTTTFSGLVYHDVLTPEITGLSYIGVRNLLVCDRRNKCLKLFSEKLLLLSSIDVPDIADVTSLNDTTAVVSQPEMSALLYIGFELNSKMFIRKAIETKGKYWGVENLNQELFTLCMSDSSSQASIHMLNQTGQVLSIIQPHLGQGYDLQLKSSKYFAISPAGGTFYISDSIIGVVAIGTDGRAIFSVQSPDIERPSGIQADSKSIYVCCPATNSLVTISPDGMCCFNAVSFTEGMVLPNCVALAPNTSQVALAFMEGETISLYNSKNFKL